jgi:hypothetical protein
MITTSSCAQFSYESLFRKYKENGNLEDSYNYLIYQIAFNYLKGTKFDGKLNINEPIDSSRINFIVLKTDPDEAFLDLSCNCGSIGYGNVIVCDIALFKYLESRLRITDDELSGAIMSQISNRFSYFLAQWIIGHEIGHIVLGHKIGQFYQSDATQDNGNYIDIEHDADFFSIRNLNASDDRNAYWFWLGLSNMISTSYPEVFESWMSRQKGSIEPIEIHYNKFQHPPWLFRYVEMVQLLLSTFPDDVTDNSGYFPFTKSRMQLIESKKRLSYPFCDKIPSNNSSVNSRVDSSSFEWSYARANEMFNTTNYKLSEIEFQNTLSKVDNELKHSNPQLVANIFFKLGVIHLINNELESATNYFRQSAALYDTPETRKYLSIILIEKGDFDGASEIIEPITSNNHYDDILYLVKSFLFYNERNDSLELENISRACAINEYVLDKNYLKYKHFFPQKPIDILSDLSTKYLGRKEFGVQKIKSNEDLLFHYGLAYSFYQNRLLTQAEASASLVSNYLLSINSKNTQDSLILADTYNLMGMLCNANNQKGCAIKNYISSIQLKKLLSVKRVPSIKFLIGQSYYNLGNIYLKHGPLDSCLIFYQTSEHFYEEDQTADAYQRVEKTKLMFNLGKVYFSLGEIESALHHHSNLANTYGHLMNDGIITIDPLFELISFDLQNISTFCKTRRLSKKQISYVKLYQKTIVNILKEKSVDDKNIKAIEEFLANSIR